MHVLVAGGAGFVGSHLCEDLVERGHHVICVDNCITGSIDNVAHLQGHDRFVFVNHDVRDPMPASAGTDRLDAILHLASPASPFDYLKFPIETLQAGSLGTFALLDLAVAKGARFLLASTSEVYGEPEVHPQTEEYWGHVNPVGPRSVYDEAKRFAEAAVMAYHREFALDTKIVRLFNTYGPRMREHDGRVVPTLIGQALDETPLTIFGDGNQTRSFCYVEDIVRGIAEMMLSDECGPINLGNPDEMTISELASTIAALTGSTSPVSYHPLPQDDPTRRRPDISKAQGQLNWAPETNLKDGLKLTIEWFRAQRAITLPLEPSYELGAAVAGSARTQVTH